MLCGLDNSPQGHMNVNLKAWTGASIRRGRTGAASVMLGLHSLEKPCTAPCQVSPRHRDICAVFLAAQLCLNEPDWA